MALHSGIIVSTRALLQYLRLVFAFRFKHRQFQSGDALNLTRECLPFTIRMLLANSFTIPSCRRSRKSLSAFFGFRDAMLLDERTRPLFSNYPETGQATPGAMT